MSSDGVLLIEWPDRAWQEMPPERLLVRFEITGEKSRRITFEGSGERYEATVRDLLSEVARTP
jgi:tRNA A37 threonylcarbamoyladenosine biosynthesis protein TsaE